MSRLHAAGRPVVVGAAFRAVGESSWRSVVARGEDSSVANDDRTDLPTGASGSRRDQTRDLHEVAVPAWALVHRLRDDILKGGLAAGLPDRRRRYREAFLECPTKVSSARKSDRTSNLADGQILACHWRVPIDGCPQTAEQVHAVLQQRLGVAPLVQYQDPDFLLDLWSLDGTSVARHEDLR